MTPLMQKIAKEKKKSKAKTALKIAAGVGAAALAGKAIKTYMPKGKVSKTWGNGAKDMGKATRV